VPPAGVGCATVETNGNFTRSIAKDAGRACAPRDTRSGAAGKFYPPKRPWLTDQGRVLAPGVSTVLAFGARP
jgi:hypothetical protein